MRLTKEQKNLVKAWMAAGLQDYEIIDLAKKHVPPFHLTKQNLSKTYRTSTERKVRDIVSREKEDAVLRSGLALKENRIRELAEIYQMAKDDVRNNHDGRVRTGMANVARGCLDDIAKELGERREKIDMEANVQARDILKIMNKVFGDD